MQWHKIILSFLILLDADQLGYLYGICPNMDRAEAICHWQADLKTLVLPFGLSSLPPTSVVKAASSLEVFEAGSIAELILK